MKKSIKISIALFSASFFCLSNLKAQTNTEQRDTLFKSYSVGLRVLHLYDLPGRRFDTDLSVDMFGLNGDNTKFDLGFDLYVEKQFTPLLGAQLGFRYGTLTGANDVEYYENTFTEVNLDLIFILSNLDAFHTDSKWNYYGKLGLGRGNFTAEQFLIADNSPDDKIEDGFWEGHLGLGIQYELNSQFRLELEAMYNVAFTDGFDGFDNATGSDTYLATAIGVAYTFGSKSKQPTYSVNYFGQDYLTLPAVKEEPHVILPESGIKAEDLEELEDAVEDQSKKIASNQAAIDAQRARVDNLEKRLVSRNSEQVYFAFDSSVLGRTGKIQIARALGSLENKDAQKIKLIAYADKNGDSNYNKSLMESRGESVKRFLTELGFNSENIIVSTGESDKMTKANEFLNRKVIIEF